MKNKPRLYLRLGALTLIIVLSASAVLAHMDPLNQQGQRASWPLRRLAERHNLLIGASTGGEALQDEQYANLLAREFNAVATENALKFSYTHPEPGLYTFDEADAIFAFARQHEMQVWAHNLIWDYGLPDWLVNGGWTREQYETILREHIQTVVGRYRGQVYAWVVINEAVNTDGTLADTFWRRAVGDDYMEKAFRWAHAADPQALLFYNDAWGEGLGPKSDAIYALLQDMQSRSVPVHGVGLEMHTSPGWHDLREVEVNMRRLAGLGLQVHITEMDVRLADGYSEANLVSQAQVYADILSICLKINECQSFILWGLTDKHSWIPYTYLGWKDALIFDGNYQSKPAYHALHQVLEEYDGSR